MWNHACFYCLSHIPKVTSLKPHPLKTSLSDTPCCPSVTQIQAGMLLFPMSCAWKLTDLSFSGLSPSTHYHQNNSLKHTSIPLFPCLKCSKAPHYFAGVRSDSRQQKPEHSMPSLSSVRANNTQVTLMGKPSFKPLRPGLPSPFPLSQQNMKLPLLCSYFTTTLLTLLLPCDFLNFSVTLTRQEVTRRQDSCHTEGSIPVPSTLSGRYWHSCLPMIRWMDEWI